MPETTERLSFREKLSYGLGDAASNFFFQFVGQFGLFYYTDIFKLPPAVAGTMFLIVRVLDAVLDPLVGIVADRTRSRWGKYRPWLLFGAVPYGLLTYAMFTNPAVAPGARLAFAYVTYILAWTAYSAINIPYSALMGVISPSSEQRTSVSTIRFVCAFIAALLIGSYTVDLKNLLGRGDDAEGIRMTMLIFAAMSAALFLVTFAGTKERVRPHAEKGHGLGRDLGNLLRNRAWVVLFLVGLTLLAAIAVRNAIAVYYFKYNVGAETDLKYFNLYGFGAFIAGTLCTKAFLRLGERRKVLVWLYVVVGLIWCAFAFVDPRSVKLVIALNLVANFIGGPEPAILWAMYAECADFGEWKFGSRSTALVFSSAIFSQKAGLAIGAGLVGWLLRYYGFVANQVQGVEASRGITIMLSFVPGALSVAAGLLVLLYPMGDADVRKVETELAARKAAAAP
jgi:GPH family glycoside/pentoside/hexuronide:cation symporter